LSCRTERAGLVLKTLAAILLPLPLLLLPVFAIVGSLLGGIGYGLFVPLMATLETVGEGVTDKLTHCFLVCRCCCSDRILDLSIRNDHVIVYKFIYYRMELLAH
jgi:hypothetical protein